MDGISTGSTERGIYPAAGDGCGDELMVLDDEIAHWVWVEQQYK